MKEGEKVNPYSEMIQAVANQMRALGEGRSNFDLVVKILASMPKSYAPLSSLTEETKDLKTVTYAELVGSLEAQEKKYFPDDEEHAEDAFHARFRGLNVEDNGKANSWKTSCKGKGNRWCGFCKKENHNEDVCYLKNGRKKPDFNRNKDTRECYNLVILQEIAEARKQSRHKSLMNMKKKKSHNYNVSNTKSHS